MWHDIRFSNAGSTFLSVTDGDDKTAFAEAKTAEFNPALVWRLEDAGNDLVRVKGYKGTGYLAWNGSAFTAKADEAGAALFRINEYIETGADRDKWLLHYVGATDANQYLKPNDAKDKVVLAAANALRPTALLFEEKGKTADVMNEAQAVYFSTSDARYWYVIRFCENKNLVLRCDEDMPRVGSYPADSPAANAPDNMKWKLEVSDKGEYYLVSKNGRYVYYANNRFRTSPYKNAATQLHLIYNTGNTYPYAWQIQCWGSGYSMNPNGGIAEGNEMAQGETTHRNGALLFEPAEDLDAPIFLQFSSCGRLALYDAGEGNAPEARQANDDAPADPAFTWVKTRTIDDGYTLHSGNGNYIALSDDGTGLVMTKDATKAVTIHTKQNPYAENVFDSGQRQVHRKMYYIDDKKTENKAITIDPANGSISLQAIAPATRATVIRETTKIDAGELPVLSTDETPVWYNIYFTRTSNYLSVGTDANKLAVVQKIDAALDPAMMWRLESTGSATSPDEFRLKNRNGDYLNWDATNSRFNTTTDASAAAPFRLAEYIENGPDRDKWTLHYVTAKASKWIQYLKPYDGTDNTKTNTVVQAPATDPNRAAILFRKMDIDQPDYCTTDNTDWRRLYFYNAALSITKYVIYEPEDYTAYRIIPKRSWFIKQVEGQDVESNSFIHATEDGSYGMKKFALKNDLGQLTGDSIKRQNTNDYRVVRYMKRNTTREFRLPTSKYGGSATQTRIRQYQRWYNYDTDGLVPDSLLLLNKPASRNYCNGTLIGEVLPFNGQTSGDKVTFGFNFKMPDYAPDDFEYTLGIDMSFYTDFVEYYGDNGTTPWPATTYDNTIAIPVNDNLVEPTLAQRCIYVVRNAHIMAKELTALSDKQSKWLEEYNIAFPAKKVNFRNCSLPLDNELANYWIYRDSVASEENLIQLTRYANLEFKITNNDAGISLDDGPIVKGATGYADPGNPDEDLSQLRFFRFKYPTTDGKEQVPNGSTADIEVYAKDGSRRYRLAVYHLTFEDGTELRPHAQIIGMKDDGFGNKIPKSDRSPRQLRRDLGEPKAAITFDFDTYGYRTFQAPPQGQELCHEGRT